MKADVYCIVCEEIDGQVEVESGDTVYIVHGDCAKGHNLQMDRSIQASNIAGIPAPGNGVGRDSMGRFTSKSK